MENDQILKLKNAKEYWYDTSINLRRRLIKLKSTALNDQILLKALN